MKTIRPFICGAVILASAIFSSAAAADRYLLIVETAKAMKRELPAVQQCVRELLASGMSGQLKPGDTLGVWTYNNDLHAGDFPMQVWEASATAEISKRVDDFLGKQHCQNEARISHALSAMLQVIADSDRITVLIFSDGFEPVQGTPFDEVINRVFAQHREELRNVRIPFVTVLQAVGGKIIHCTINSASGPINIPALPKPKPAPAVVVAKPALPAPAPVIIKTNPPLILDYSKPASNAVIPAPEKIIAPIKPPAPPATPEVAVVVKETPKPAPAPAPAPAIAAVVTAPPPTVVRAEVPPVVEPASPVPAARPAASNTLPVKPTAVLAAPVTAPAIVPPVVVAAAIPAEDVTGWVWLAVGLAIAGAVGWLVWRSRSKSQVSAITESIERGKR